MRRLVATTIMIACSGLTAGCGQLGGDGELGELQTFEGRGFEVELPCSPTERTDPVPVPGRKPATLSTWTCEGRESAYAVSMMALPRGLAGDLDGAAQGAALAVGGTLASSAQVTYAGARGRDIRVESSFRDEPATAFARVLLHRRTLYQVQVLVTDDVARPPARYDEILESLSFR